MARTPLTPRLVTDAEAEVLERALQVAAVAELDAAVFASVRSLRVVGRCECGCASVDFCAPTAKDEVAVQLADAMGFSDTGEELGIIVWGKSGDISGLEVYSYTDQPAPLPVVASIAPNVVGTNAA